MDRRTFLASTGVVLLTAPLAGEAQQAKKVWRIGFLSSGSSPANLAIKGPFRAGLHDLGSVEGRDFVMEWRWAEGHQDRLPGLATDLVRAGSHCSSADGVSDCPCESRAGRDRLKKDSDIRTDFGQKREKTKARQDAAPRNSVLEMAGSTGLEPATSGLTVQCANQAAPRARLGDVRRLHDAFPDCNLRRRRAAPLHRLADAFPF